MLKKIKKFNPVLILAIILSVPAVLGLLHSGFPLTDDGNWMVIRFSAFYEVLRSGEFPVRFLSRLNNGFGYPVADFLYPLFMYIGVPIHVLGIDFVNTVKIILILSLFSSTLFTYLWLKKLFDNISSLIGSLFYTFFPYHLYDVYKRGSVGEVLALSILPFVLWQIERKSLLFVSVGIAFLILSHNTLALLFFPLIIIYLFLKYKKDYKFNLLSIVFGLGISSFFWLPAIYDQQFTVFGQAKVSDFSSYFVNNMDYGIFGIGFVFLLLEIIFYVIKTKNKNITILLIVLLALLFFTFSYSNIFWQLIPFTNLIQFPFRIVSIIIPVSAFCVAYLINKEKRQKRLLLVPIYLILIFISAWSYLFPKVYQNYPDTFYSTNQDSTTVKNEYMPKWVKQIPTSMANVKVENLSGKEAINITKNSPNKISFNADLSSETLVEVNTIYFPGWNTYVNGSKTKINYENPSGLIQMSLNKGNNNVLIEFSETTVRIISDFISLVSLFVLLGLVIFKKNFKFVKI